MSELIAALPASPLGIIGLHLPGTSCELSDRSVHILPRTINEKGTAVRSNRLLNVKGVLVIILAFAVAISGQHRKLLASYFRPIDNYIQRYSNVIILLKV